MKTFNLLPQLGKFNANEKKRHHGYKEKEKDNEWV